MYQISHFINYYKFEPLKASVIVVLVLKGRAKLRLGSLPRIGGFGFARIAGRDFRRESADALRRGMRRFRTVASRRVQLMLSECMCCPGV